MPTAAALPAAAEKPNVLWLMSDEHSVHAAGWLGNSLIRTPSLDGLAKSGAAFQAAYCQNPVCVPSRASFLTGRMPSNVGVFGNDGGLQPGIPTMARFSRAPAYARSGSAKRNGAVTRASLRRTDPMTKPQAPHCGTRSRGRPPMP